MKPKAPDSKIRGETYIYASMKLFFSHPDYTVGSGISPDQPPKRVADYTAGRESHPAPKNLFFIVCLLYCITLQRATVFLYLVKFSKFSLSVQFAFSQHPR